jgi:hypothetical protein
MLLAEFGFDSCGWTAILPIAKVAWVSVNGIQDTDDELVLSVPALVDFHIPPYAPPAKTVLPLESLGSTATAVTRPETNP